ncbi:MAG: UDP-N-acetylmuramoyl-tripeptide--D-alanyl-D-alanine ligase [Hyphomicrobiaceae bacterium]
MAEALWTFDALVVAAAGHADGVPAADIAGFSIDTRTLAPGDVFVALKDQRDGHDFVPAAFAAGAAAALVSEPYKRKPGDGALIRVADPLEGLRGIARAARARLAPSAKVIAVTGSAGKTTTKEMLRAAFATCGKVHAADKSFNNHWGVPLTLARMPADTQFAIFEIGMNHAGEITPLTGLVRPHVAIVTNVLPVHVGNFPDGEIGVANAKAEIFAGLEPGGVAIVLRDSPHFERLKASAEAAGARVRTFGRSRSDDVAIVSGVPATSPNAGFQEVTAKIDGGEEISYRLFIAGEHIAINSLAVVAALDCLCCAMGRGLKSLISVEAGAGRGSRLRLPAPDGPLVVIDESYNGNPESIRAALDTLAWIKDPTVKRRIAVLGDMLELGERSVEYHVGLLPALTKASPIKTGIDLVFACGPHMKHLFERLPPAQRGAWAPSSAGLIAPVLAALQGGDAVMVKGSLGSRMAPIVDAIKKHFAPAEA